MLNIIKNSVLTLNHTNQLFYVNTNNQLSKMTIENLLNKKKDETIILTEIANNIQTYLNDQYKLMDITNLMEIIEEKNNTINKLIDENIVKDEKIKSLIEKINMLKLSSPIKTEKINITEINKEILHRFMEINKTELMINGIGIFDYKIMLDKYCEENNLEKISHEIIKEFMKPLCMELKNKSGGNSKRKYKLEQSKYFTNTLKSPSKLLTNLDGEIISISEINNIEDTQIVSKYEYKLDEIEIDDNELIQLEKIESRSSATGFDDKTMTSKDILIIHKSYYYQYKQFPSGRNFVFKYNNKNINIKRQLEYIKSNLKILYNKIIKYCYNDILNENEFMTIENAFEKTCNYIKYCVENNIKFKKCKILTKINNKNGETDLYRILTQLTHKDSCTISNLLKSRINELIDFTSIYFEQISKNKLNESDVDKKGKTYTCTNFYNPNHRHSDK